MTTFLWIFAAATAAVVLGAAAGLWWLRRAVRRPVPRTVACAGGSGPDCSTCSSPGRGPWAAPALLAAAAGGGGGTTGGGGGAPERRGPDRRTFLRGAMGLSALGAVGGFGAATLAFIWPDVRGGFGAVLEAGNEDEVLEEIDAAGGSFEFQEGRALLVRYDPEEDSEGLYTEITMEGQARVLALYQVCPHLGCTVPWCDSSQWWECPCHGSAYNRWGEYQEGPAPRGMDRFPVEVDDAGTLLVDTSEIVEGPTQGQQSLLQPREGPSCI